MEVFFIVKLSCAESSYKNCPIEIIELLIGEEKQRKWWGLKIIHKASVNSFN